MSSTKPVVDNIENTLEQHRARLEASLKKLQKALRQWQTYSAEYEGLKEELQELPADASRESMIEVGYNFGGTVVDLAEVFSLLGDKLGIKRSRDQFIRAIDHRIDYVTENIKKVEEQLEKGAEKLASLLVVQGPEILTEDGEPIIEVREELDEAGNIISSSTQPHGRGNATSMNIDDLKQFQKYIDTALEEAKALSEPVKVRKQSTAVPKETPQEPAPIIEIDANDLVNTTDLGSTTAQSMLVDEIRLDKLSLGDSVLIEARPNEPTGSPVKVNEGPVVERDMVIPKQRPAGGFVSDTDKKLREEDFVLSVDELPDAADLRRQMIDYNLHDIGAVVAEIDLEEDYGNYVDEDYDEDEEEDEEEEEDEDEAEEEDKYGRSTSRVITADIEREMQVLQARIRERQEEEAKKRTTQAQLELPNAVQVRISPDKEEALPAPKKKGVTFSDKLDVSIIPPVTKPDTQPLVLPPPPTLDDPDDAVPFLVDLLAREQIIEDMKKAGSSTAVQNGGWEVKTKHEVAAQPKKVSRFKAARMSSTAETDDKASGALADKAPVLKPTILERQTDAALAPGPPQAPASSKPKKVSRFKSSRTAPPNTTANPPFVGIHENTTLNKPFFDDEMDVDEAEKPPRALITPTIIEKPPTSSGNLPMAPSELDPTLHKQEVAVEYFRTRNKMIQKEGGFLPREEEEMYVPLDDGRKKMSRFKAARLGMGQAHPK